MKTDRRSFEQRLPARGVARGDLVVWIAMIAVCIAALVWGFAIRRDSAPRAGSDRGDAPPLAPKGPALPEFTMTDQNGSPFGSDDLRGRAWIADFIFTNCAGPCPLMTRRMAQLQDELEDVENLSFVSFSVDPARDTPEALAAYAEQFDADLSNWSFLTGDYRETQGLAIDGFKLLVRNPAEEAGEAPAGSAEGEGGDEEEVAARGAGDDASDSAGEDGAADPAHTGPILHSVKFVLVDPEGRIVDWYTGTDEAELARLEEDARRLAAASEPDDSEADG